MSEIIAGVYELEREIGSGGGGVVYLGRHIRLNKKIVLKADKRSLKTTEKALRREVEILKELTHSYIPKVYDYIREEGIVYTVIDYIEGESLDKLLKRGEHPSQPMVIKWACQLLEALCYLHSRPPHGILHGDIKPANIMLRPNGDICLIDFNIALALKEDGAVKVGSSFGYASPEHYGRDYRRSRQAETTFDDATRTETDDSLEGVAESDSVKSSVSGTASSKKTVLLDVRSDIYSLGATLYHLISGTRPPGDAMKVDVLSSDVCSRAVAEIIKKAMEPDPSDRYQSAQEMLTAFRQLHKNDIRAVRHRRYVRISTAVLAGMFLTGGCFSFVGLRQLEQRQNALALSEYSANALAEGDVYGAVAYALSAIPEGGLLDAPVTAQAQKALTDALGVYELSDGFYEYGILELPAQPFDIAVSPDGAYLAAVYAYETRVYRLENREEIVTLPIQRSALSECIFTKDHIFLYAGEGGLTAYDLNRKETLWRGEPATTLTLSQDGQVVAAVNRDESKALVYNAVTGERIAECSFSGKHLTVAANDIFANPKDDIFTLNQDGSLLAVSFADGGFRIFDLYHPENDLIIYEDSPYRQFQGGFHGRYFAFTAQDGTRATFDLIDTEEGRYLGSFEAQEPFLVKTDEEGIYLANGGLLVRFDPVSMEETELAFLEDQRITEFSVSADYTLVTAEDNSFAFFDKGAKLMQRRESEALWDFARLSEEYAVLGSRNTTELRTLKLAGHREAEIIRYDAAYQHDEARISPDADQAMLFRYQDFSIYNKKGELIAFQELPQAEQVYDQQFRREGEKAYLEVIWYDGTVRCYDATDGSLLSEQVKEAPDKDLYEEFYTENYLITSELHARPEVYDLKSGELLAVLESDSYLTYVTQLGDYLITEYISTDGERFGLLLNERFETIAYLPGLCDVIEDSVVFDHKSGNLRQSRLYSLDELIELGEAYIAQEGRKEDF